MVNERGEGEGEGGSVCGSRGGASQVAGAGERNWMRDWSRSSESNEQRDTRGERRRGEREKKTKAGMMDEMVGSCHWQDSQYPNRIGIGMGETVLAGER